MGKLNTSHQSLTHLCKRWYKGGFQRKPKLNNKQSTVFCYNSLTCNLVKGIFYIYIYIYKVEAACMMTLN